MKKRTGNRPSMTTQGAPPRGDPGLRSGTASRYKTISCYTHVAPSHVEAGYDARSGVSEDHSRGEKSHASIFADRRHHRRCRRPGWDRGRPWTDGSGPGAAESEH